MQQSDKPHRLDEVKTQFKAREGYYLLMNSPNFFQRSQRALTSNNSATNSNSSTASNERTCIKISLVTISEFNDTISGLRQQIPNYPKSSSSNLANSTISRALCRSRGARDMKICFNVGRELFVYNYDGVRSGPDISYPIFKRSYKGSSPTCHDFNQATADSESLSLLVGFSHGQIQLIDLNGCDDQEACKDFNVDRLIDKTRVTCIKWLPNSPSLFLVAHASGQLYLYKDNLPCGPAAPTYQLYKQSEGVMVHTCKTKTTRNPIYKWTIGGANASEDGPNSPAPAASLMDPKNESCSLNEFVFSPCAKYLACVSQDGFLRVYCYDTMELVGRARSYYGGLSCVCWSPDGRYVVTGGEDDLITVWSFVERRVVARGMGHKSWVSVVTFDSFYTGYDLGDTDVDNDDDEDEEAREVDERDLEIETEENEDAITVYNNANSSRYRNSNRTSIENRLSSAFRDQGSPSSSQTTDGRNHTATTPNMTSYRFGSVGQDTQLCLWDLNDDLLESTSKFVQKPNPLCPRMNEVPVLEPSVCKKISHERLTSLIFCKAGFITSCQDGYVFSWARPSRISSL